MSSRNLVLRTAKTIERETTRLKSLTYTDREYWNSFCLENLVFEILVFNYLGNVTREIVTFGKQLFGISLNLKKRPNFDSFTFVSGRRVIFSPDATMHAYVYVRQDR